MNLKQRCQKQIDRMNSGQNLDLMEDLTSFVVSEIGRAATSELEPTLPLCLYFGSEKDREEFVALIHAAKPGMIAKRWP